MKPSAVSSGFFWQCSPSLPSKTLSDCVDVLTSGMLRYTLMKSVAHRELFLRMKVGLSPILSMSACFLSSILAWSQVQFIKTCYGCSGERVHQNLGSSSNGTETAVKPSGHRRKETSGEKEARQTGCDGSSCSWNHETNGGQQSVPVAYPLV
jgi:hypothetical protein